MSNKEYRSVSDLPAELPVFPLSGALLFPRWSLPLNIFEPRYLNMIDDAMSGDRLIGMVQTTGGDRAKPDLARIGCAGRITEYSETDDGRYLIVLQGICRFVLTEEPDRQLPYRSALADWSDFAQDLTTIPKDDPDQRDALVDALESYLSRNSMKADWNSIQDAELEPLVNALSAGCPFEVSEKQALLEAPTLTDRCKTLIALLEMDVSGNEKGWLQ